MAFSEPNFSESIVNAWPIDTSSKWGSWRYCDKFCKFKSWPALTPRPSFSACSAALTCCLNNLSTWPVLPLSRASVKASAYGPV